MNHGTEVALVLLVALLAANWPFLTERVLLVGPRRPGKAFIWRLVELALLGAATLGIGFGLEARIGQVAPQNWEFFVAAGCLYLTLGFPGFVWRYLRRRAD
jgi:hypothetical protein